MSPKGSDNPEARMSLADHLREFRKRLVLAISGIGVAAIGGWLLYDPIMGFITEPLTSLENANVQLNFQTIGAGFDLHLRIALWAGFVISSPWWIYQLSAFIAPGLRRKEKLYVAAFGLVGVLLFISGAATGIWLTPRAVSVLQEFVPGEAISYLQANNYVSFYLRLVVVFGVSFLLPEVLVMLSFMGALTSKQMLTGWRWAVIVAFTFAAIANPLPSPWPMIIQAGGLLVLYFLAVLISWVRERYLKYGWHLRPQDKKTPPSEDEPYEAPA